MAGRGGMAEGGRHVAQAGGERDVLQGSDEGVGPPTLLQVDREDRAEALAEKAGRPPVIGMLGEPG